MSKKSFLITDAINVKKDTRKVSKRHLFRSRRLTDKNWTVKTPLELSICSTIQSIYFNDYYFHAECCSLSNDNGISNTVLRWRKWSCNKSVEHLQTAIQLHSIGKLSSATLIYSQIGNLWHSRWIFMMNYRSPANGLRLTDMIRASLENVVETVNSPVNSRAKNWPGCYRCFEAWKWLWVCYENIYTSNACSKRIFSHETHGFQTLHCDNSKESQTQCDSLEENPADNMIGRFRSTKGHDQMIYLFWLWHLPSIVLKIGKIGWEWMLCVVRFFC